ncbi:MAG: carotenoid biosynthesis protein [Panacibacter sp.]
MSGSKKCINKEQVISYKQKINIALFITLLFHVSGAIGILFTPYKDWFIRYTPLNLLLMAALLVFTQRKKNISFYIFLLICFGTGMVTEAIGVNTGYLFGNYVYGEVMGRKLFEVPLLIGINWFVIIFCAGTVVQKLSDWVYKKIAVEIKPSVAVQVFSFITDAALLTTFFDWVMEPVAIKLGFWQWLPNGEIPLYNFLCWFIISAVLLTAFRFMKFDKHNQFAVHLFMIQLLFFLVLQTFL